jgi:probable glucitol transport protein GutA
MKRKVEMSSKKIAEAATKVSHNTYTKKELAGYLTGLAGQNIIYNIIATGLAFYFQSVIFLPAIAVSLIFALARVWDAVNDPMMGSIVDKTRTKWGKCKPYLLFVPGVILITTILPFINGMYAKPTDQHEIRLANKDAYVEFSESLPYETIEFTDEKEYGGTDLYNKKFVVASVSETGWELKKDADGKVYVYTKEDYKNGIINENEVGQSYKNDVIVYEVKDGEYTAADETIAKTVVQEFQNTCFVKVTGGKAAGIIAWAAISYVLWGMTYTIGDIPLWGVTSLMTEDQGDRAKVLTLARAVANVGMIGTLFTMIAPSFQQMYKDKGMNESESLQYAYITLAVVMTLFASVLFQVAGIAVKERVSTKGEKTYTIKENFKIMFGNKPFRQILISGILRSPIQLLGIVAMTLIMYYFFNNDIGATLFVGEPGNEVLDVNLVLKIVILVVGLFGGMIGFPLFVPKLIGKFEKKSLYNFFTLVGAIPFALIFIFYMIFKNNTEIVNGEETMVGIVTWGGMIIMSILFFMAGASMGSLNVLQSVMIADCVDYEEYCNGIRPDGVFFSGQSFITKLSAGIASLISGAVYAYVGFSDKNIAILNNALIDGENFKSFAHGNYAAALFFLVAIPPAIGMALAAIPTLKYALTDKEHTRILDELVARRATAADEIPEAEEVAEAVEETAPLTEEKADEE